MNMDQKLPEVKVEVSKQERIRTADLDKIFSVVKLVLPKSKMTEEEFAHEIVIAIDDIEIVNPCNMFLQAKSELMDSDLSLTPEGKLGYALLLAGFAPPELKEFISVGKKITLEIGGIPYIINEKGIWVQDYNDVVNFNEDRPGTLIWSSEESSQQKIESGFIENK